MNCEWVTHDATNWLSFFSLGSSHFINHSITSIRWCDQCWFDRISNKSCAVSSDTFPIDNLCANNFGWKSLSWTTNNVRSNFGTFRAWKSISEMWSETWYFNVKFSKIYFCIQKGNLWSISGKYMACCILYRGDVVPKDINGEILENLKTWIRFHIVLIIKLRYQVWKPTETYSSSIGVQQVLKLELTISHRRLYLVVI